MEQTKLHLEHITLCYWFLLCWEFNLEGLIYVYYNSQKQNQELWLVWNLKLTEIWLGRSLKLIAEIARCKSSAIWFLCISWTPNS